MPNRLPLSMRSIVLIGVGGLVLAVLLWILFANGDGTNQRVQSEAATPVVLATITEPPAQAQEETPTPTTAPPTATPAIMGPQVSPLPTATPVPPPTATPTPSVSMRGARSAVAAGRFARRAAEALSTLPPEEREERGRDLLKSIAISERLELEANVRDFVRLEGELWAYLVVPHTIEGFTFPVLLWQQPSATNSDETVIQGQLLTDLLETRPRNRPFLSGVHRGALHQDQAGNVHLILAENPRPTEGKRVRAYAFSALDGEQFQLTWRSEDEPFWDAPLDETVIDLMPGENELPVLSVRTALLPDSPLRRLVQPPPLFMGVADDTSRIFHYVRMDWTPVLSEAGELSYRPQPPRMLETPLTVLARFLLSLQNGQEQEANQYVSEPGLVALARSMNLDEPGAWRATYLERHRIPISHPFFRYVEDSPVRELVFYDDEQRQRTFLAQFERIPDSDFRYQLTSLARVAPYDGSLSPIFLESVRQSTPSPLPTPAATDGPVPTSPTATPTLIVTSTVTAVDPITGTVIFAPARLRTAPASDAEIVAELQSGVAVTLIGITRDGLWVRVIVDDPASAAEGSEGWMTPLLLEVAGERDALPVIEAERVPPTPTPQAVETPAQTDSALLAPSPAADEVTATVISGTIPANPLQPIRLRSEDGDEFALRLDGTRRDQVQIWSALFGADEGTWLPARGELLWPGTRLYLHGLRSVEGDATMTAARVRIAAAPPDWERTAPFTVPQLAVSAILDRAVALLGDIDEPAILLLNQDGSLAPILGSGQEVIALNHGENAGGARFVVPLPELSSGRNGFWLLRKDGIGVQILARPFQSIRGVAEDAAGAIYWLETPAVDLDQWQLWRADPVQATPVLVAQASQSIFAEGSPGLRPRLIAVRSAPGGHTLWINTEEPAQQRTSSGLYRLTVRGDSSTGEQILPGGSYRSPLHANPQGDRLAFFAYDPDHPSLTAGGIQPPNQLWILPLDREAVAPSLIYETETRFEFLSPNLIWRSDDELILGRSRFSPDGVFDLEQFGIVHVAVPEQGAPPPPRVYLFPTGTLLQDFAVCHQEGSVLLALRRQGGPDVFARWPIDTDPVVLGELPAAVERIHICWRRPSGGG